jgi:hypothetical protein
MQNLQDVYNRIQDKKREYKTIARGFQDELKNNARYAEILEEMKKLKEEKKSFEQQAKAAAVLDASKMETLKLDMENDRQTLTDIALNMYVDQQPVEIIDKTQARWSPEFSVKFKKSGEAEAGEQLQNAIAAVEAEQASVEAADQEEVVVATTEEVEVQVQEKKREKVKA